MDTFGKETMAKHLQLQYWNKLLFENGTITQKEYLQMADAIRRTYPVA
mgnify:CR=1 FL=1|jgi:hypothetical protein